MNAAFQPLFANGMVIMVTLAYIWIAAAIASGVLALTALVLAIRRRAATVAPILAGIGCAIGVIPVALAGWVFVDQAAWPRTFYQFGFAALSVLPILLAIAALLITRRHSLRSKFPATSSP